MLRNCPDQYLNPDGSARSDHLHTAAQLADLLLDHGADLATQNKQVVTYVDQSILYLYLNKLLHK